MIPKATVAGLVFYGEKILLLKSHKWKTLCIPGGKIEYAETAKEALVREVKEETGLDVYEVKYLMTQELIKEPEFFREDHFISINFICKTDKDKVTLNDEAEDYLWMNPKDALRIVNKPTKDMIRRYFDG